MMAEQTTLPPGVPRPSAPKIRNAAAGMANTLKAIGTGLDLTADELVVAAFMALGVRAMEASLPVRAWLASMCSLMDVDRGNGDGGGESANG